MKRKKKLSCEQFKCMAHYRYLCSSYTFYSHTHSVNSPSLSYTTVRTWYSHYKKKKEKIKKIYTQINSNNF